MNYGMRFVTLYRRQGSSHPHGKKCKKAKWLSGEALQIAVKRREAKSKGEKERCSRYYSDEYADKIMKRANDPNAFVPIEIKLAK